MKVILYETKPNTKPKWVERKTVGGAGLLSSVLNAWVTGKAARQKQTTSKVKPTGQNSQKLIRVVGNTLIVVAVVGCALTVTPVVYQEWNVRFNQEVEKISFGEMVSAKSDGLVSAVPDAEFSIFVPKIHVLEKVIPNVDAGSEQIYRKALKEGVAHAAGTGFPGEGRTIFLFAHSVGRPEDIVSYNAVFYLLKELEAKDRITLIWQGKKFSYEVFDKKVVEVDKTEYFNLNIGEVLVLQTCWPPGTTWQRILVMAKRV